MAKEDWYKRVYRVRLPRSARFATLLSRGAAGMSSSHRRELVDVESRALSAVSRDSRLRLQRLSRLRRSTAFGTAATG
jgi:hypothetical protein